MFKQSKGFTLIELLVVMAIIGTLTTVILVSVSSVRNASKSKVAKGELESMGLVMELYLRENGHMPPDSDSDICSVCHYAVGSANVDDQFESMIDELVVQGYLPKPQYKDPWGNDYVYDNNYNHACDEGCKTALCSLGPDGDFTSHTAAGLNLSAYFAQRPDVDTDDICVFLSGADTP